MADVGNKEAHVLWAEGNRGMGGDSGRQKRWCLRFWVVESLHTKSFRGHAKDLALTVALNSGCSPQLAGELPKNINAWPQPRPVKSYWHFFFFLRILVSRQRSSQRLLAILVSWFVSVFIVSFPFVLSWEGDQAQNHSSINFNNSSHMELGKMENNLTKSLQT